MRTKKLAVLTTCFLILAAAWYFKPSHAQTLEEAQKAEQTTASLVKQTAKDYQRDLHIILDTNSRAEQAEASARFFLTDTKKLHDLRGMWTRDVDHLEQLATEKFTKWRTVIDSIKTMAARLPEEENYARNYQDFQDTLNASRAALAQLSETLKKGNDVTACIESRKYDTETKNVIGDLQTVTTSVRDHADEYIKSCDRLVELLQRRDLLANAR